MSATLLVHQLTGPAGEPAVADFVIYVDTRGTWSSLIDAIMQQLRPLSPRETTQAGAFLYSDPGRGAGWIEVQGVGGAILEEVRDAVRAIEISVRIGQAEPAGQTTPDLFQSGYRLTSSNPYVLIGAGIGFVLLFLVLLILSIVAQYQLSIIIILAVGLIAIIPVSILMIVNGARRRRWWHGARAEARRQGIPMPGQLDTFS